MTRVEVYTSALDRQIVVNCDWTNPDYKYVKIGSKFLCDTDCYISEINMLTEKDVDTWKLKEQISRFAKLKLRIRLLLQVWRFTK